MFEVTCEMPRERVVFADAVLVIGGNNKVDFGGHTATGNLIKASCS